ncbi:girdin-like [Dorcoceras hygrometricum]|uniref:Girdin-like n=1 Tax=Dorcoceras hygrometricum TaxID=472368 RepID=A0A2Z7D6L4_9LAMI|nr:girdin-like [Dorcoceras hygrometricum]
MTDETKINGELSGPREVEISGDDSAKVSGLTVKASDLEQENDKVNRQNKEYKQQIEELEDSAKVLNDENDEFRKQVNKVEVENKALGSVFARAAELEGDVSRLQHDLVSAMSDLQETTAELSEMRSEMTGIKQREEEKDYKSEALEKERNLLVSKVENFEGVENSLRNELEGKEREIGYLKNRVKELETMVESSKNLEELKSDLEKTVEKMKVEITVLETCLDEKERMVGVTGTVKIKIDSFLFFLIKNHTVIYHFTVNLSQCSILHSQCSQTINIHKKAVNNTRKFTWFGYGCTGVSTQFNIPTVYKQRIKIHKFQYVQDTNTNFPESSRCTLRLISLMEENQGVLLFCFQISQFRSISLISN